MKITTRPATQGDEAFAREAHHMAYHEPVVLQFGQWDQQVQDRYFEANWASAAFDILLMDGVPCGYTRVDEQSAHVGIVELVVHPRCQRKGVGSTFLRGVMERAAARGVPVKLGTFRRNPARAFYEKLGFRQYDVTETHVMLEWER